MHMVAIDDMYCQLIIFSLLFCIDGQDEPDVSLSSCSKGIIFDDGHLYGPTTYILFVWTFV
jgi:hypothetical protein